MAARLKTNDYAMGPEFASVTNAALGTYRVYVYKDDIDQAKAQLQLSGATVTAWSRAGEMKTWTLAVPAFAQAGVNLWNVVDVSFGADLAAPTYTTLDEVKSVGNATDSTSPAYCVP